MYGAWKIPIANRAPTSTGCIRRFALSCMLNDDERWKGVEGWPEGRPGGQGTAGAVWNFYQWYRMERACPESKPFGPRRALQTCVNGFVETSGLDITNRVGWFYVKQLTWQIKLNPILNRLIFKYSSSSLSDIFLVVFRSARITDSVECKFNVFTDNYCFCYRPLLKQIKNSAESHIVLDCTTERIYDVLKQAQQIGMMSDYHSYLITSLVSIQIK